MNLQKHAYILLVVLLIIASIGVYVIAENESMNVTDTNNTLANDTNNTANPLLPSMLVINNEETTYIKGDIIQISATLNLLDGTPLTDQNLKFFIDSTQIRESLTDENGLATISFDTSNVDAGEHILSVDYAGSETVSVANYYKGITITENTPEQNQQNTNLEQTQTNQEVIPTDPLAQFPEFKADKDCINETYTTEEPLIGNCPTTETVCDNENPDTPCTENTVMQECTQGTQTVERQREKCKVKDYIYNNAIKFDTNEYTCTITKDQNYEMICDSIHDGNGDGICTSGESCMKFVIIGDNIQQYEKNSRDDFITSDDSYFLNKVTTEATQ